MQIVQRFLHRQSLTSKLVTSSIPLAGKSSAICIVTWRGIYSAHPRCCSFTAADARWMFIEMDVYKDERELIATRELREGDITLMIAGGHGFRMQEDTMFLEIKPGPYTDLDEKLRF
jgi:hypothetical protein